jgi:RNA polymerase sigma-70 factor, ECF subfamily
MTEIAALVSAARNGDESAFGKLVAPHRRELRAYCYRMAGSLDDADDLLQESLLRAWRGIASFEGRSSIRTWLYRVTWSACVDALEGRGPRMLAVDLGPPAEADEPMPPPRLDGWLGPCPAALYADESFSPEARYGARESVALAFLAALQLLTPKQRATLLARDVLGWSAEECAVELGTSVASVNSALQRARDTLDRQAAKWRPQLPDEPTRRALLARYIQAWEQADVAALTSLLHEEATLSMPPLPIWLLGPRAIGASLQAMLFTPSGRGAFRFLVTEANGVPALATYQRDAEGGFVAASLQLLTLTGPKISALTAFLEPRLMPAFGLPASL